MTDGTISAIQRGERYRNAGGSIREPHRYAWNRKFDDNQRAEIRHLNALGDSQRKLARMFDCSRKTIQNILKETD